MDFPIRINKYLAHKGLTTRKEADQLISDGKVRVNGQCAVLGQQITATDTVTIEDKARRNYRYFLYYKPRSIITHSPTADETDIVTRIEQDFGLTNIYPIGRLDKDSEGLIFLTDDGRITERLLSPNASHEKEYRVVVDKKVQGVFLKQLENGVDIEGYTTKPAVAVKDVRNDRVFYLTLTEGKKHQVRRMCAALGYQIESLSRIRILDFTTQGLEAGEIGKLSTKEATHLKQLLGLK